MQVVRFKLENRMAFHLVCMGQNSPGKFAVLT